MHIIELLNKYKELAIEEDFNYEEFNKILITSHSTRIEGSTLTYFDSMELIEKGNTPGGKPLVYSLQTIDHYNALNFVISQAQQKRKITKEFIQEIASKVMNSTGEIFTNINGTVDASKGEFRKTGVRAGNTSFMNYQKVIPALDALCDELNKKMHLTQTISQIELSFFAHYELVNIHPFLDGNGRTARLLMNFIQKRYNLPLSVVFSEDKQLYYQALNSVREQDNFEYYYRFMMSQYEKYLQNEINNYLSADKENKYSFKRKI